ncbi:MAG: hypothetical protein WCL27_19075, partial [Betaproteobacteria bacterium]
LLLAAVFFLPFIIGTGLFWTGWRPGKFVNHGELLQPARALPENGLHHVDGRPFPTSTLRGKWLLVLPVTGTCDTPCQQQLLQMQNVHVALNKEQSRLQRVFISNGAAASTEWETRFPELLMGVIPAGPEGEGWHQAMDGQNQTLYVVDPLGNVMMRYPNPGEMRGVLKDLERLLKYSWIR